MNIKLKDALLKQLDEKDIKIRKGTNQDPSYIESDREKKKPPFPVDPVLPAGSWRRE